MANKTEKLAGCYTCHKMVDINTFHATWDDPLAQVCDKHKSVIEPIAVLREQLETYQITNREFISINICLSCQATICMAVFPNSRSGYVEKIMNFTIHTCDYGECLLCQNK